MTRPTKTIEEKITVEKTSGVHEKDALLAWLRSGRISMFERDTRWLAARIEEGDHLK
jgi:hypothetical protein